VTPQEAIKAAELAETEIRYRNQLGREMYQAGYRQAEADMAARWDQIARPVVHGISHAELEERRWGPGGRAHFGDPRPGDFKGLAAAAQPEAACQAEPEPEAEIG
jgi:hypothetical protein